MGYTESAYTTVMITVCPLLLELSILTVFLFDLCTSNTILQFAAVYYYIRMDAIIIDTEFGSYIEFLTLE